MELAVIAMVAMFVLGPDRLPDLARQAARFVQTARKMAHNARDELRTELGPEYSDLELRDLDPRNIVRKHIREALAEEQASPAIAAKPALGPGQRPPFDAEAT